MKKRDHGHAKEPAPSVRMLDAVVREQTSLSWGKARELVRRGKVCVNGEVATEITRRVKPSDEVVIDRHAPRIGRLPLPDEALLYVDDDVVVVSKPAGLMTVPYEDEKDTLVDRVQVALRRGQASGQASRQASRPVRGRAQKNELGVVQRLDKETTGVLVFARTLASKRALQQQFRAHSIERRYLALVHGDLATALTCEGLLVRDRGAGLKGSFGVFRRPRGEPPPDAQRAVTHVRPLERLAGATLIECQLETGRQHQIRIHLSEHGHPLLGEPVYIRDYQGPRIEAGRPMLHAAVLGFSHPRSGQSVRFELDAPEDFVQVLERLRLR
jgi:23S rRNA pseudouridine1911/1915/1917 synthase